MGTIDQSTEALLHRHHGRLRSPCGLAAPGAGQHEPRQHAGHGHLRGHEGHDADGSVEPAAAAADGDDEAAVDDAERRLPADAGLWTTDAGWPTDAGRPE